MSASINALGDQIKALIETYVTVNSIENVTVARKYQNTHDIGKITGRKIDIFPVQYMTAGDATRSEAWYDFLYSIVVLERYTLAGDVPQSWCDAIVEFVEQGIFKQFDVDIITIGGTQYLPTISVPTVFDYDMLKQHRVFWSEVELTLRKLDDTI